MPKIKLKRKRINYHSLRVIQASMLNSRELLYIKFFFPAIISVRRLLLSSHKFHINGFTAFINKILLFLLKKMHKATSLSCSLSKRGERMKLQIKKSQQSLLKGKKV